MFGDTRSTVLVHCEWSCGFVTRAAPLGLLLGPGNGSMLFTAERATWPTESEVIIIIIITTNTCMY